VVLWRIFGICEVLRLPNKTRCYCSFFYKEWLQNKLGKLSLRQRPAAINWTDRQDAQESAVAVGGYCEPLSMEAEKSPLLEATANQRLVKT
jgi:hypothetical protein